MNNPSLPMIVRLELHPRSGGPSVTWVVTSIDAGFAGHEIVNELSKNGEATTHAILFAFDSAELEDEAKPLLDSVARFLTTNANMKIEIQGHTDDFGGPDFNLRLSQKRADAVKGYLVSAGIRPDRLTAKGYGLGIPVADNATPEGRARNRRVVFVVLKS